MLLLPVVCKTQYIVICVVYNSLLFHTKLQSLILINGFPSAEISKLSNKKIFSYQLTFFSSEINKSERLKNIFKINTPTKSMNKYT